MPSSERNDRSKGRLSSLFTSSRKKKYEASETTVDLTDSFRRMAAQEVRCSTVERFENSEFGKQIYDLPTFDINEIVLGKRLGKGGFSNVDEVQGISARNGFRSAKIIRPAIKLSSNTLSRHDSIAADSKESRQFIAEHCFRRSGDARYAIKQIRRDVLNSEEKLALGLGDLAIETKFLSSLEHPNVIKLRAISSTDPFTSGYFLVLDRLYDTLQKRIELWRAKRTRLYSFWGKVRDRRGKHRLDFYENRLEKVFDLSAAVEYLHSRKIIHRDIKPENIGFDCRGDIKIFDFGLARELRDEDRLEDGTFKLSQLTGSLRYMAPEVGLGQPYNSACDVYSFGVVLWETVSLKRPYSLKCADENEFARLVFDQGTRPDLDRRWSATLRELLHRTWGPDPHARPCMQDVTKRLRAELVRLRHGDDSYIADHQRRRSTFVFESKALLQDFKDNSSEFLDRSMKSNKSLQSFASSRKG